MRHNTLVSTDTCTYGHARVPTLVYMQCARHNHEQHMHNKTALAALSFAWSLITIHAHEGCVLVVLYPNIGTGLFNNMPW